MIRWGQRLVKAAAGLGAVDRLFIGAVFVALGYVPFMWWGAELDIPGNPLLRDAPFEAGFVILCACFGGWLLLLLRLAFIRSSRQVDVPSFYAMALMYCVPGTVFALAIGWDTAPWIPLLLFGCAAGGFIWMDRPRETWFAVGVVYVVLGVGVVAELLGWIPHAFALTGSPIGDGEVALWWHVLIGGYTLVMSGAIFGLIRYIMLRWQRSEQAVDERNALLHRMFGRYMSTEVVRALLDNPDDALRLGGEQREVTLLMSGLRGFTHLSARLEPPAIIALLNDYFEVMVDVCLDHQGTINEIVGDTLLIIFGAPGACDDHADRAIGCALAMQRAMARVNERNRALGRPVLEMGIGLNTGQVVVGNIGSSKRTKYGVVGSHVNRTARIESYTTGGQVLASEAVLERAKRATETGEPFTVRPKGGDPIEISPVLAIDPLDEQPSPSLVRSSREGWSKSRRAPSRGAADVEAPSQAGLWNRLIARFTALPLIDRCIVGCLFVLSCFPALIWYGASVDAATNPIFREGWFDTAYVILCICGAGWVCLTVWGFWLRRQGRDPRAPIRICLMLYTFQGAMFSLGLGWDTSPWLPMVFFGAGCCGFIWVDSPGATWMSLIVGYVTIGLGIVAEAVDWVPHAFIFEQAPNQGGEVAVFWHVLIGGQTVIATGLLFPMITYVLRQWKARERDLAKRNALLRSMFGRYMSLEVMRTLLEDPERALDLGGRQVELTLLMSDLRGFTALAETLTPTETIALLNDYFDVMVDIVIEHQGNIDEIIGDALLVVFGAPAACPDHADRAVACAIAMQRAMAAVNDRNRALGRPVIEMGIGVNTGEVVVGNVGSSKRTKYGVVGGQVNRTMRIESYTVGGQVIVSQATLDAVEARVEVSGSHTVQAGGDGSSLKIHVVDGIGVPFDLRLPPTTDRLVTLATPQSIRVAVLSGKHVDDETFEASIVALGPQAARLDTDHGLSVFDNVELILVEPMVRAIYAKVLAVDGGCIVRITSMPAEVRARIATWTS